MTRPARLASLLLLLLAPPIPAADAFVVQPASGKPITGVVREIVSDRSVIVEGPTPIRVGGDDLIGLRRLDVPLPARPTGPRLLLANGDEVPGAVAEITRERITLIARTGTGPRTPRLGFPLSAVQAVWLGPPGDRAEARRLIRLAAEELRGQDAVFLRNGERLQGTFTGLTDRGLDLEVEQKPQRIERHRVQMLVLDTDLVQPSRTTGPYARLVLASGARLALIAPSLRQGDLMGMTLDGDEVVVPWTDVVSLDVRQGPAVYLSDLKPRSFTYVPFLPGLVYSWQADRALDGGDLLVGGQAVDKGLGLHDGSRLTYALAGAYRRFEATVALDERSPANACVRVRVIVDGKAGEPAFDKEITGSDGPQVVRVELPGATELTLEAAYAGKRFEGGRVPFAGGRLNVGDARLIKAK